MGVFLAVHSTKNNIENYLSSSRLEAYHDGLNIEYNNSEIIKSKNGQFAFIHYERSNALYDCSDQTYISTTNGQVSMTLLQGYLWKKRGSKEIIKANQLHMMLESSSSEDIRDQCNGEYSVIHYNELDNKLLVFNDRLSLEALYYYKDSKQVIISNRIRLIREALQNSTPDFETLNWITAIGFIVGEGTSEELVSRLPQGAYLTIKNNKTLLHENNIFMIDSDFNNELDKSLKSKFIPSFFFKKSKNDINTIFNDAIEECATNVDLCLKYAPDLSIPMSGGKDSRAVFSLLNYFGERENINLYTNGFDGHSDVIVAKKISDHFNCDLQINTPTSPTEVNDDWVFKRMMGHVFQADGMFGAWDAKGYTACRGGLSLTGFVGEVYRSPYNEDNTLDLSSIQTASKVFHSINLFDRAGLLTPSARIHYEQKLEERLSFYLDNGAQLTDAPDLFFTMERVPNWVAALKRTDGYSQCMVNPLNTETLAKLAYYLGSEQRRIERIHFEIINRSNPWLASHKFADDRWNEALNRYSRQAKLATDVVRTKNDLPRFGSWQYKLRDSEPFRHKLLDIFMSYPQSSIWDYCDKKVVEEKFKKGLFPSTFELVSAYGFINAFFYAHHVELPMKIQKNTNK